MKKKLTLLTLAMLLVLAACGNKTDAPTGTSAPASAGESKNASKESEKETGAVESVVKEVSDAIEEAAKPQKGDVTNKMYFGEDVFFTSAVSLEFDKWEGNYVDYSWKDEDHYGGVEFMNSGYILHLYEPLNTPEGEYRGVIFPEREGGNIELTFMTEDKDGEKYEIRVASAIDVDTYQPDEEYVKLFLQLVEEFLNSGIAGELKMSDIRYDLSVPAGENFFTSPDAIAAE